MTQPGSDSVIGSADEVPDPYGEGEADQLYQVRPLLDRLYADEDSSESERAELISQILIAGADHEPQ